MDQLLKAVASNLWYEWNPDAAKMFNNFSPHIWSLANRNPHRFLALRAENPLQFERRFAELMMSRNYMDRFERIRTALNEYLNPSETVASKNFPELHNKTIAYFSMEYGFDTLKTYSGGLGILSGDHLRGASDLGLKMVAVGLFYIQGYYEQRVTEDGEMLVTYDSIVPARSSVREYLPLESVKKNGSLDDLVVRIPIGDHEVSIKAWRCKVGRVELLLLDSNLKENHIRDRHITRRLYASEKHYDEERRRRIEQEIVLGIGGARILFEAGYNPNVFHLNEGHVAFAALEVIRRLVHHEKLSFHDAQQKAASIIGFTTHTPVSEGNERFHENLARAYLSSYIDTFAPPDGREFIFNCARNKQDEFDMTKLSLLLSGACRNGVSELHGEVCRKMWAYAWGDTAAKKTDFVPIEAITNGVHIPYWQAPEIREIIRLAGGYERFDKQDDRKLWEVHQYRKLRMIVEVRERAAYRSLRLGRRPEEIQQDMERLLDPEAFIIGFARRFAGYKRTTFFVDREEKLFDFLERSYRKYGKPIHILFSGKPHPNNHAGREQIKHIYDAAKRLYERAKERDFKARILFIEGYDIALARRLVSGTDIWLNNPIRPMEASGTSGMKAAINGVLNVSTPDGWIPEGVQTGVNGWIFGKGEEASAEADRNELFTLLENTILPLYFERSDPKLPYSPGWVRMMKNSVMSAMKHFSIERMLNQYAEKMYLPAVRNAERIKV